MKRSRESEDEDDTPGYGQDAATVSVSKIINLDTEELEPQAKEAAIQCSLPGHARGTRFSSYAEYEKHYIQAHSNRCHECGKNFPTWHILSLHIQEHHDALMEVRREKGGSTYACFVEACKDEFLTYKQREEHLIQSHTYPDDYFFAVTKFGINDRRQSMLVGSRNEARKNDSQRKDSGREGRKPKGPAAKPAAHGDVGDVGESKDVQMADAGGAAEHQHGLAQRNKPVSQTPLVAKEVPVAREAAASSTTLPSEKQGKREPAAVPAAVPTAVDTDMEELSGAMSSLKFVPRAVRLGPKQKPRR